MKPNFMKSQFSRRVLMIWFSRFRENKNLGRSTGALATRSEASGRSETWPMVSPQSSSPFPSHSVIRFQAPAVTATAFAEGDKFKDLHRRSHVSGCNPHDFRSTTDILVSSPASPSRLSCPLRHGQVPYSYVAFDCTEERTHEQVTNPLC